MIKNLLEQEEIQPPEKIKSDEVKREAAEESNDIKNDEIKIEDFPNQKKEETIFQTDFKPESKAETIRKSGLAYAAAITLFGSIVFMLLIGWFFDLLMGTSPWGIVGGIVLGAILGFFQFFKLTSQIINDKK